MSERSEEPTAANDANTKRFDALYEQCYPAIHAYCARRVRPDTVDDAVAETFLVAWRRISDVPDSRDSLLWLYRVAGRVIGHQWRGSSRRRRLQARIDGARRPLTAGPEDRAVADDECRTMLEALDCLRPEEAELLRLVAWEHLTAAELAVVLDTSSNTASQRLSRARKRLAREFDRLTETPVRSPAAAKGGGR